MKLYITRHGKTKWNIEGRFQGAMDSELVEKGIRDAHYLHNYLANQTFDMVYTSPLGRAKQTTQLIFEGRHENIKEDGRLMEMNFGVFEGMKTEDILKQYGELYDDLWNHPEKFTRCPNGGESFAEVNARIVSFLNDLKSSACDKQVFIVTHGMFLVCLLGHFLGYQPKDYPLINRYIVRGCSLTIVDWQNDHFEVQCIGDDHFLPEEQKDSFLIKQKKM